ncbi:MAG: hypothetical protein U0L06_11305 [Agathobacter sp.]|nr:hypothetical protein [Agathobacter sp.]
MNKLLRYPFITGASSVKQARNEKNDKYDPYNKRNVGLLYKAFSAQADSINTEYSLNDSTWD